MPSRLLKCLGLLEAVLVPQDSPISRLQLVLVNSDGTRTITGTITGRERAAPGRSQRQVQNRLNQPKKASASPRIDPMFGTT